MKTQGSFRLQRPIQSLRAIWGKNPGTAESKKRKMIVQIWPADKILNSKDKKKITTHTHPTGPFWKMHQQISNESGSPSHHVTGDSTSLCKDLCSTLHHSIPVFNYRDIHVSFYWLKDTRSEDISCYFYLKNRGYWKEVRDYRRLYLNLEYISATVSSKKQKQLIPALTTEKEN